MPLYIVWIGLFNTLEALASKYRFGFLEEICDKLISYSFYIVENLYHHASEEENKFSGNSIICECKLISIFPLLDISTSLDLIQREG